MRRATAEEVRGLRHAVLRPGRPASEAFFAGDELDSTTHWTALDPGGKVAAVASLYEAVKPGARAGTRGWQLRGMASRPELRGKGFASAALKACIEWARASSAAAPAEIWCNARESAEGFYLAHGFAREGEAFDIPTVGPHRVMSLQLGDSPRPQRI